MISLTNQQLEKKGGKESAQEKKHYMKCVNFESQFKQMSLGKKSMKQLQKFEYRMTNSYVMSNYSEFCYGMGG